MEGVRNVAYQLYRVLIALIAIGCVVQIFLAGRGVFGIHGAASLDDQKSLDAHRALGNLISLVAVVTFLVALLMWNKRLILWTLLLAVFAVFVQHATALPKHPWVSGIHPVSGIAILGIAGWLAHQAWAGKGKAGGAPTASDG
jgi:uncharacterized protein DUF6220